MLSRACEYGVKAVICLTIASREDRIKSIGDISRNIQTPEAFTAKVLQKLVRAGLVNSIKGKNGGFYINKEKAENLKLWDVVQIIDGDDLRYRCLLGLSNCSNAKPCPVHESYKTIREDLVRFLKRTEIKILSDRVIRGESILKIETILRTN
ncbi:MAG: Rrf2 family transcriptional regulator [Bacteroidia bacterium]|nr:Rrf2 family transcriptional regulator [Bacteroidia bacterium]